MIAFFARHPTAANLLMLIMVAAGLMSVRGLRRETLPDAAPVEVEVSVVYPGATAEEVDLAIVGRLEEELNGVQYLKELRSFSLRGIANVTLEMAEAGNYVTFRNEIENGVNAIDDFPDDAEPPIIRRLNTRDPVLDLVVQGPLHAVDLKAYCERLKDRLMASPKISEIEISGFSDHLLRVEVSREALLRHGLSPTDVSAAISNQSIDLPVGRIDASENSLVRVEEERRTPDALRQLVLAGAPGAAEIRIDDVGTVVDVFELDEDRVEVNGTRGAVLKIRKSKTEDSLAVANEVQRIIKQERQRSPDFTFTITNDLSALVEDRISLLLKNGWQGCVMVFMTMWLFFNARLSFWVVMSLPVSFLAAFAIAPSMGLTINMLTMVGLLMAIGLLMDDGIVIAENIARRRAEGEPALTAAVEGVKEVGGGVFSSFLTTCCVLGPLIFLAGDLGRVLRVLPMMLLLVLSASLLEAFLILPSHLGHSLAKVDDRPRNRFRVRIDQTIDAIRDGVGKAVEWTIRWRYLTAGLVVMAFMLTVGLIVGGFVKRQVFPDLEGDTVVARVLMEPGTPLARTEQVIRDLGMALDATNRKFKPRQPAGQDLVETTYVRFNENLDAFETGPHVATMYADLLTNEVRDARISEVVSTWREELGKIPDAISITFDEPVIGPQGRALEIELSGCPLEELDSASDEIQDYLQSFVGVYNVSDDLRRGQREWLVKLRPGAVGLGVSARELARQLRGSFQGLLSDQVQVGSEGYDVEVRFADEDRNHISDLENFRVTLPSGKTVPLVEVATLQPHRGWSRIQRFNGRQVVNVYGNVDTLQSNAMAVLTQLRKEKLPEIRTRLPSIEFTFRGEAEKGEETGGSLLWAASVGCLGVFVILSFQFRSYIEPLIVMIAIPFAFVGVVWGHLLFMMNLSLPSLMGYASLAGIVVNDSILLMLFLKSARAQGVPIEQAAADASRKRFRAVMITSMTTIAGLSPLLIERSLQAQVLIPIAISICCGLLASTVLVLVVLPSFYVLLADFGLTERLESLREHRPASRGEAS